MSKGNMLLGHARGKVGDLVFSRSNGEQVVRARAAVVKNPKTELQTVQRIILNTVAQAYSKMQPIVNHSFEGVSEGQRSMSRFMRTNLDRVRARVAQAVADNQSYDDIYSFSPIGTNQFAPNEFVIASGSLPSVAVSWGSTSTITAVAELGGETYAEIIAALGLQRGDQLTFCMIKNAGAAQGEVSFDFCRVILDPTNADGTPASLDNQLVLNGAINLPSQRNTGVFTSIQYGLEGRFAFDTGAETRACYAAAIIVSRQSTSGEWQRSNTQLAINERATAGFTYSLDQAIQFSQDNNLGALSDLYLNNAGQGALANAGSGLSISVPVGTAANATTPATIVRIGYQNVENVGNVLMATDDRRNSYVVAVGAPTSIYVGRAISAAAATSTAVEPDNTEFPPITPASTPKAFTTNDLVIWLSKNGYISPVVLAVAGLIEG